MKSNHFLSAVLALLICTSFVSAQNYEVSQTGVFPPQNKKVLLLKEPASQKTIILFQTKLRVNTDGSPLSYHPQDPRGKDKALNNICNAIVVNKGASKENLCFTKFNEAISVFERFRDSNYQTIPQGYRITWGMFWQPLKKTAKMFHAFLNQGDSKDILAR